MPSNLYGYFRHEKCGSEVCSKIANFEKKTTSLGYLSGDVDDVHEDPDLIKNVVTGDESWVYYCDIETKVQSS